MMNNIQKKAEKIFSILSQHNPNPKTELIYTTPFTLLIAVLLSAQATDIQVNKATKKLFMIADTPEKMLALGLERLEEHIKTIGLYKSKAKNVLLTSHMLLNDCNSIVPDKREILETLPGVGRKTANVVLNELYKQPTIAVDTHIFRVSNRIGLAIGQTPLQVENELYKNIPEKFHDDAHHHLILHGRYICKARKPLCKSCVIAYFCDYSEKEN